MNASDWPRIMWGKLDETNLESEKAIRDDNFGWLPKSCVWQFEDQWGRTWIAIPNWLRAKLPWGIWVKIDTATDSNINNLRRI